MIFEERFSHLNISHSQWHHHGNDFSSKDGSCGIDCAGAWKNLGGFGGNDPVTAVIDDGCHVRAPNFDGLDKFDCFGIIENERCREVTAHQFLEPSIDRYHRHGTSMCSLISGSVIEGLPHGVAPEARLLPVRWSFDLGDNRFAISEDGFLSALDLVLDRVDIVVNTWVRSPRMVFSERLIEMIQSVEESRGRRGKGVLFVWAAGNTNTPINLSLERPVPAGFRPIGCRMELSKYLLAMQENFRIHSFGLDNVLLVGAVNRFGARAHYSNYGTGLSITAPSSTSCPFDPSSSPIDGLTTCFGPNASITNNFKGTSGSAALVAGVANLIVSANNDITASGIKKIVTSTATKVMVEDFAEHTMATPVDRESLLYNCRPVPPFQSGAFDESGWSPWFGSGLVNAERAVRYAQTGPNQL